MARRNLVAVQNRLPVYMSCGTSYRLRKASLVTQESRLVGIKDGYKRYFGQVETFAKKVHAH